MSLDNLSELHATKHKLLWQGHQRELSNIHRFTSNVPTSQRPMSNVQVIQALKAHRQNFVDEATGVSRRREIPES